jgi:hypothetical protein
MSFWKLLLNIFLFIFCFVICVLVALCVFSFLKWVINPKQVSGFKADVISDNDPKITEIVDLIRPIFDKTNMVYSGYLSPLNNRDIMSEIEFKHASKSFTINKKVVHMCLKDEKGNYYDNNSLVYVLLHEIAHVINTTVGHDQMFNNIFNDLLIIAEQKKIYDPNIPMVNSYCEFWIGH